MRRLRPGDRFTVGDGQGSYRVVQLGDTLAVAGPIESEPPASPTITVGFALTKADRPELAVQKLTEVGVDVIAPFTSARSVVRWDADKASRNLARWRTIAREAAAQCHRPWLPVVADLTGFGDIARLADVALAHPDGTGPTLDHPALLIGPEGGWSPEEEAAVPHRTCLGPHILRAETAAVAAGALLAALRGHGTGPLLRPNRP